jgi:hypothetical protein
MYWRRKHATIHRVPLRRVGLKGANLPVLLSNVIDHRSALEVLWLSAPVLWMPFISRVADGCPLVVVRSLSTSNYYTCTRNFEVGKRNDSPHSWGCGYHISSREDNFWMPYEDLHIGLHISAITPHRKPCNLLGSLREYALMCFMMSLQMELAEWRKICRYSIEVPLILVWRRKTHPLLLSFCMQTVSSEGHLWLSTTGSLK